MMSRLLHLAAGQVRVRVTGRVERFLNLCIREGVTLHEIRRRDWNSLEASLSIPDFRRLGGLMGRTGCRVHILRRVGGPFFLYRTRRRYVFWVGLVLTILLCVLANGRLWLIRVQAPPSLPEGQVRQSLRALGVTVGAKAADIDFKSVRRQLMMGYEDVVFVSINRAGGRLEVELQVKTDHPPLLDENAAVSIVAKEDGTIDSIDVLDGEKLVKKGDSVLKGDKLVDALVPPRTETGSYRLTHAQAVILAHTRRTQTVYCPLTVLQKVYTGKRVTQYALIFGQRRINLYLGSGISGAGCDKIESVTRLRPTTDSELPLGFVKQTYLFYETEESTRSADALAQTLTDRAHARSAAVIEGEIERESAAVGERQGAAVLDYCAFCLENIAEEIADEQPIPETKGTEPENS